MTKLFILLLFVSCATPFVPVPPTASVRTKNFPSVPEAKNFIRNKRNYLTILFEQSRDPYYGTPRWPEECLRKHLFGEILETNGNTFFISRLLLNAKGEPGDCFGAPADVAYLHCKDDTRVSEIVCPPGDCDFLLKGNPCPMTK